MNGSLRPALCISFFLLTTLALSGYGSIVSAEPFRVMTFNIRGDFDLEKATDSSEAWNALTQTHRRDLVISTIGEFNPDLLGVQEAFRHQVRDLLAGLSGYESVGVGRDDGKEAGEYSAILYRTDRFRRINDGTFWLSKTPDEAGSKFPDAACVRIATWIVLADRKSNDREVFVLNTHWDHISEEARQFSAQLIRERLRSLAGDRPMIVMGDLNSRGETPAVKTLIAAESAELPLVNSFREVVPERGANEASFHDFKGGTAGSPIDFILHNRKLKAREANIVHRSFDGRYPSDHFPLTAVLTYAE